MKKFKYTDAPYYNMPAELYVGYTMDGGEYQPVVVLKKDKK